MERYVKSQWNAQYNPFGNTSLVTGTLSTQSLRLPGQTIDPETGMNHNGFRDYAGSLTRYVESDPIGLKGGTNTFQYVKGNPFQYVDRKGLETTVVVTTDPIVSTPFGSFGSYASHSGLYVGNSGAPMIYDPSGQYYADIRGSGDAITGDQANLASYIAFENSLGSDVNTYTFPTSPSDESAIVRNIDNRGGGGYFGCASSVSSVLAGVGPFKDLTPTSLPSNLADQLQSLPNVTKKTYPALAIK